MHLVISGIYTRLLMATMMFLTIVFVVVHAEVVWIIEWLKSGYYVTAFWEGGYMRVFQIVDTPLPTVYAVNWVVLCQRESSLINKGVPQTPNGKISSFRNASLSTVVTNRQYYPFHKAVCFVAVISSMTKTKRISYNTIVEGLMEDWLTYQISSLIKYRRKKRRLHIRSWTP